MEPKTVAFFTLGCKLNFAESSSIAKTLFAAGVIRVSPAQTADVCVINTCSVTDNADKKCRQAIHKIVKQNPSAYVIVTGCYAQLKPEEIVKIEGVDLVIGTHPHVIQPVEWVEDEEGNRMLVYYSLGNFINSTADSGVGIGKRILGGMAKVTIAKDATGKVFIKEYGVEPLITQIMRGPGNMTTYKLDDYTEELARTNQMTGRDPQFSIESTKEVCREVFGELYIEE